MFYTNCNSSIKLSSGTSPRFTLNRGVRQGCPISPYLFLIATELPNLHIIESPLKGITVDDTEVVISQLADDTVLFLKDASQVAVALETLEPFSKASGLRLNINKCELLPVGHCLESLICNIPVRESITYLGVKIIKDDKIRCPSNFLPIIEKTRKVLNHWLQRDLSLKGRVLLTKAEGISRLSYAAQSISVDKHTCKLIDSMLTKFLWKNKIHYIKKSVILNTHDKGGLNFIDFSSLNSNFQINWIRQYLKNSSAIWNIIPRFIFSHVGGLEFLLMCNYKIEKLPVKLSKFYQQVLATWNLIYKHNFSPHSFFIWNNANILYRKKYLFFHKWFSNGLLLVNQLFNNEGNLFSFADFISRYKIPITLKEFKVLTKAIPAGILMLFKSSVYTSTLSVCPPRPEHTSVGTICFSGSKPNNYKIRSLFLRDIISTPYVISYWNSFFNNVNWTKVWSLPQKFLLTNKVKEISYKLIHRVYPTKVFLQKF
uniref:Reverse transcriptase domain-containing protein n=1 Tax=Cyprinus carpio carpio TaxID=630221 RepID=A0A9J8BAW3_CYPCA